MMTPTDSQLLQPLLRELSDLIGLPATLQFFEQYQGMRINIPAHLYDSTIVAARIKRQSEHRPSSQALAARYGYSRRWVDTILQTAKRGNIATTSVKPVRDNLEQRD